MKQCHRASIFDGSIFDLRPGTRGTLEPQPLEEEGGASFEENADLSAPFDVSSVKYTGLLSQRMAADDGSNQESSSHIKKSRSLSQMLADEEAQRGK